MYRKQRDIPHTDGVTMIIDITSFTEIQVCIVFIATVWFNFPRQWNEIRLIMEDIF